MWKRHANLIQLFAGWMYIFGYICFERKISTNYRPISRLTYLSNIFENVLYTRLKVYFIKNNLLSQQQYGFCNNQSTYLAITDLYENFQNLNKNMSFAVFLCQGCGTYVLSRNAWIVHYRCRAAKSINFILNFYLYLIKRKSDFSWFTIL